MHNSSAVSVIIPVYNGERYLAEAIHSVLAQTCQPIEIIVVDDGSTDGSAQVARRFAPPLRFFHQPNRGPAAARNAGIEVAQGGYFAFLDADDIWPTDKLKIQMSVFERNPGVDMVFGHVQQFISPELHEDENRKVYCPAEPAPGYIVGAMVIKRASFLAVGPFEAGFEIGEFIQWYTRAKEQGMKSFMLPDMVLRRRLHTDNMGIRLRDARGDYVRIMKASLDRRRASEQIKNNLKKI